MIIFELLYYIKKGLRQPEHERNVNERRRYQKAHR